MNNVLVLIDIQKEYTTEGRPFYLKGIEPSLANCQKLLKLARDQKWIIAHVKHFKKGASIFNPDSEFSEFVEKFKPQAGEYIFVKDLYSCFSNAEFCKFIEEHKEDNIYLIGYNSIMCCLSTVIDSYHRGYKLTLVSDAVYAKSTPEFSEADMHDHAISLIKAAKYADIIPTERLIREKNND